MPTPRLGGAALVLAVVVAAIPLVVRPGASTELRAVLVAGIVVAGVGLIDDFRPLAASTRLVVQIAGSAALIAALGVPRLDILPGVPFDVPIWVAGAVLVVWMVGVLNIYNFMDGMDGLAGLQTVTAATAQCVLLGSVGASELAAFSALVGASAGGFLLQNFPPARIFMGDAGSTFVGFAFATLGVLGMKHGLPLAAMALPLAPFLLDGTFTILRRAARREPIWKAHRTHLYQRAVQTDLGHREVLLVYAGWLGLVLGVAVLAPQSKLFVYVGWGVAVAALVAVWRWVNVRESQKAGAA
ncbi:MAG TPA: glycosyltransferase family 4 protein [Polyangiaceae bacterium]